MTTQTEDSTELRLALLDYDGSLLDAVSNPVSISGQVTRHGLGTCAIQIDANDTITQFLQPGVRAALTYRGQPLDSGMIRTEAGTLAGNGTKTFQMQSDWRMLVNALGFVVPTGSLVPSSLSDPAQAVQTGAPGAAGTIVGQTGYYVFPDAVSSAESAIKQLLTDNIVTRLNRPMTIAPNQDRGGDARSAGMLPLVRMTDLATAIGDLLDWSGLTLTIVQPEGSPTVLVDVTQPEAWTASLTVESGIVSPDSTYSRSAPSATRAIVGGPGEDAARAFWSVSDTAGLEAAWHDVIEVFKDATGATLTWPSSLSSDYQIAKFFLQRPEVSAADKATFQNYLIAAGRSGLTDGLPNVGVSAQLSEKGSFYFGGQLGAQLGTKVTIAAQGVDVATDAITAATYSLTRSDGMTVTPVVGEITDDPDVQLMRAVRALADAQTRLSRER